VVAFVSNAETHPLSSGSLTADDDVATALRAVSDVT
jgi:hypothetical protein